ncbi:hypothetical protein [Burkholderia sp. SCN-KJ]|uniref:hypothetical protein n=1 Tax=Burkholderia sp. SCN-KJ TaxID=2969248 RepID=UPI00214F80EF|nr:hypothetical protein [Burkholderia sp. SCN-KJ]MCR4471347.1 hypothetical protein [Burkholderia sp. SCN-KJ]
MKFTTRSERQMPFSSLRNYYIDLIEQWPEVYKPLLHAKAFFRDVLLRGTYALTSGQIGIRVGLARPGNFNARFKDMRGRNPFYRISQFDANKRGDESAQAACGIASTLAQAGVVLTSPNETGISGFGTFRFTDSSRCGTATAG